MTYTDIDKQFSEKFEKCDGYMCGHETTDDHYVIWDEDIKQFLHLIYSQAKAEQRKEDALIAEGKKINDQRPKLLIPENSKSRYGSTMYDAACDSIASEIRGQHECKQTTQESLQVKE